LLLLACGLMERPLLLLLRLLGLLLACGRTPPPMLCSLLSLPHACGS
jgi:hypothetical protein